MMSLMYDHNHTWGEELRAIFRREDMKTKKNDDICTITHSEGNFKLCLKEMSPDGQHGGARDGSTAPGIPRAGRTTQS